MGREFYNYPTQLLLLYHSPIYLKRSLTAPTYLTHRPPPTPLFQYTPLSILPLYHSLPLSHYFTLPLSTLSSSPIAVPPPPSYFPSLSYFSLSLSPSPSFSFFFTLPQALSSTLLLSHSSTLFPSPFSHSPIPSLFGFSLLSNFFYICT